MVTQKLSKATQDNFNWMLSYLQDHSGLAVHIKTTRHNLTQLHPKNYWVKQWGEAVELTMNFIDEHYVDGRLTV